MEASEPIRLGRSIAEVVRRIRDHYVDQLQYFHQEMRRDHPDGIAEVALDVKDSRMLYGQVYRSDFISVTPRIEAIEMTPDKQLLFKRIEFSFQSVDVTLDPIQRDRVCFSSDVLLVEEKLRSWFDRWYDPVEERPQLADGMSGRIHSVIAAGSSLWVDFGSAPDEAFWELLSAFDEAGALRVLINENEDAEGD